MSIVRASALAGALALLAGLSARGARVDAAPDGTCREQRVVMLMTTWCPYCRKATAFFKQHDVNVLEIDIEKTDNERIRALKGRAGVPAILVGDTVIEGFDEPRLRRMLCIQ